MIFFSPIDRTLRRRWTVSQIAIFLYFIYAGTYRHLVNVFIYRFLDHIKGSYNYWLGGSFKVPHFLNFYSQALLFTYLIFFDWYVIICWYWHINKTCFSFILLKHYIWSISFYFSVILSYLPNPSARAGYDTRTIFKRSSTGLNFSVILYCKIAENSNFLGFYYRY